MLAMISASALAAFLISLLICLVIICVVAAVVCWILSMIPGIPAFAPRIVWAVAGIIFLIWLLQHLPALGI